MICPNCSYAMTKPCWVPWDPKKPIRRYQCPKCGWRGETIEIWREGYDTTQVLQAALWRVTFDEHENGQQT